MHNIKINSILILLSLLAIGCINQTQINNQNVVNEIQITGSELRILETEIISQRNCKGTAEVENMVEKSRTIQYVIELQNGTTVNINGQIGIAGTDIELGSTVASYLGHSYGASENITRSITVKAGIGANMQHTIQQVEIWKVGQAKISAGGQETIVPFKFRSDFSIELVESMDLKDCDNSTPTSSLLTLEPTNWAFTLEYRFPAGFWTTGMHQYSLEWFCPNEIPESTTFEFMVSDSYPVVAGDIYLRWSALKVVSPFGDTVEGINSAQSTVASIAWDGMTKSVADTRASTCTGAISWDGGKKEPLMPQIPFQH